MVSRGTHYRPTFEVRLTPRQQQVLKSIERGRTNFEIAQELGVSLEGAKYHVSEILAKLQVDSREEAVQAWKAYNSPGARWSRAFAGLGALPVLRIVLGGAAAVASIAAAAAIVALATGGDSTPDGAPDVPPPVASPTDGASPAATPTLSSTAVPSATPAQAEPIALKVYFLRGEAVAPVLREAPATEAVARAALDELFNGPALAETDSGLSSAVPAGTRLLSVAIANGVATVDLSQEFESGGGSLSMRARLAQVVYTATQFPTVTAVVFRIEGEERTVFGGEGVTLDGPAERGDFEDLTPAILLDTPAQGAEVSSPVRLVGTANTFEATFRIEVLDADGVVLAEEFATATSGSGTRGTFDVALAFAIAADGPGTIRVFESSAMDGSPVNVVEVPVRLAR